MLYLTTSHKKIPYIYQMRRDLMSNVNVEYLQYKNARLKKVEHFNGASSIFINSPDDKLNDSICLLNSENFGKLRPKNC